MEDIKERAFVLLQAMVDMMQEQESSHYVLSIFEQTAIWDDAECDGGCLFEEAKQLLDDFSEVK